MVCRDSARPVANLWSSRGHGGSAAEAVVPLRRERVDCTEARRAPVDGLPGAVRTSCILAGSKLVWSSITRSRGGEDWVVEGFGAYDSATLLALRSFVFDRAVQGKVDAAITSVGDPSAFSRIQAQTLKPEQALAEGYRRNLGGDYAEAEAYFQALHERLRTETDASIDPVEFLASRALQKSNLGDFGAAERLFAEARRTGAGDPVNERLQRNFEATHQLNRGRPDRAIALTGACFTDTAVKQKSDLGNFRIHLFATHGLVTPPRPNCPVKPALLTSFGATGSDGLLTFDEVFDLALDADLAILSACDTAGSASVEATRAAGLSSGGGTVLDGLVRAFIGAGGRAVLASHWPAPDDYRATERLMNEMFRFGRTASVGEALDQSQAQRMDDAATSHPYYWAGFALIGDATKPLLAPAPAQVAIADAAR